MTASAPGSCPAAVSTLIKRADEQPAGRFRATGATLAHPGFLKVLARSADSKR